jgi:hypothetical protein
MAFACLRTHFRRRQADHELTALAPPLAESFYVALVHGDETAHECKADTKAAFSTIERSFVLMK